MNSKTAKCSYCGSFNTKKNGRENGLQTYKCNDCNKRFRSKRREKNILINKIWNEYVFNKQTIRELSEIFDLNKKTIVKYLEEYDLPDKVNTGGKIKALIIDATYFRKEKHTETWCAAVFRDYYAKDNVVHLYGDNESNTLYFKGKDKLAELKYEIEGIVSDGNHCIRSVFSNIPIQMCHTHMKRLVIQKITMNPKTEAGQVLLAMIKDLIYTDSKTFLNRFNKYKEIYRDFLLEKTIHPDGKSSYTHDGLRSAVLSVHNNLRYLFTFEKYPFLPKTTNALEGHFSHVKDITRIHRGISDSLLQKVLSSIFDNSSIVKKRDK